MVEPMLFASLLLMTAAAPVAAAPSDQELLVRHALGNVPAITSANRTVEAGQARLEASRGGYYPAVTLGAGVTGTNSANPATGVGAPQGIETLTAGAHQELYNFGRTAAQVDAAQANLDLARGQGRDQAVEVAHQVRKAYVAWLQSRGLEDQARVQVRDDQKLY